MTRKHFRWLVALNISTIVITLLMFGIGFAASVTAARTEKLLTLHPTAKLESALEKKIGDTYTDDLHADIMDMIRTSDEGISLGTGALKSFSTAMFQTSGVITLLSFSGLAILYSRCKPHPLASKQY